MKFIKTYESFKMIDYSGEYFALHDFIESNNLQIEFMNFFEIDDGDWEEYTSGELGYDTEVIQELIGNEYKVLYNNDSEEIIVRKQIDPSKIEIKYDPDEMDLYNIFNICDIITINEPRIGAYVNNKLIGGTTYYIENNIYTFDIAILPEYQGSGIGKKMIESLIKDAKELNCDTILIEVVNDNLHKYLSNIGFIGGSLENERILYYDLKLYENHNINNISIMECPKSKRVHDFISKYLDILNIEQYLNNENLYQICSYDNNLLVAALIFRMKDGRIHMNYSAVHESYRNKGINREMVLKVIEIAKKNNCYLITSNIRESNVASLVSQQNIGFKINDKVDMTYSDGEKKIPLYLKL